MSATQAIGQFLTEGDIIAACGATFTQRGREYQRAGNVLRVSWEGSAKVLQASVRGGYQNVYQQLISMTVWEGDLEIDGDCECPVGYNCKHVAAALLHWLETAASDVEPTPDAATFALSAWRQQVEQSAARREERFCDAGKERLLYRLEFEKTFTAAQRVTVTVVKSRRLKSGGWGKPAAVSAERFFYAYNSPGYLSSLDEDILRRVYRHTQYGYSEPVDVRGDDGALLIQRLIDSGRCYLGELPEAPLQWGPSLAPEFEWREQDGHELRTTLPELGEDWLCLPTDPPYYVQPSTGLCGLIDTHYRGEELALLNQLPSVPAAQLIEVSRFLFARFNALPLPATLNIVDYDEPPTPILTLIGSSHDSGYSHFVQLQFAYGDCLLPPMVLHQRPQVMLSQHDTEWRITCNSLVEGDALTQLMDAGLAPHPDTVQAAVRDPGLEPGAALELFFPGRSRADSATRWHDFLAHDVPRLEAEGWQIHRDDSFLIRFQTAATFSGSLAGRGDWFDLGMEVQVGSQKLPLLPLVVSWLEQHDPIGEQPILFETDDHQWLNVPRELVAPIIDTLVELYQQPTLSEQGGLRLPRQQAPRLLELEQRLDDAGSPLSWRGGKKIRALATRLKNFSGITAVTPATGLCAELRPYQQQGLDWLNFLREYQFGGILADDMGLGKTLQTLAHLQRLKEQGELTAPALVVAPTSVLSNWRREANKFTPELRVAICHGPQRAGIHTTMADYDLIITSYALLVRDLEILAARRFHTVILDEAQAIKNAKAKANLAARQLNTENRLCLTGTPMENHLGELWSLFNFLMPDFLGSQQRFNQLFRNPIEKHGNSERQRELNNRIRPFMLRRSKREVASELPPKTEILRSVELGPAQRRLYESIRVAMEKKIRKLLGQKGLARSHIEMLDALLKLRQVCCDPALLKLASAKSVGQSAKRELLMQMLPELLEEGRKILIFSQFTTMLGLIETELKSAGIAYSKLTGQTRHRDAAIGCFQDGQVPVFLISLKAGGFGLNLTEADTVIHYDPWWNPAAENQATDRAHRIGQDKPVFVYKLITENTVEEKILALQKQKQLLADAVYGERDSSTSKLDAEQLLALFS